MPSCLYLVSFPTTGNVLLHGAAPPPGLRETTRGRSPPVGAGIPSCGPLLAVAAALPSPPSRPQPPRSSASVAVPVGMNAFMSLPRQFADDRNRHHRRGCAMPFARRKPARKRFEDGAKLGIGDLTKGVADIGR